MAAFTVDEVRQRLTELLDRAEAGEEIVITRFGVPAMRLQPCGRSSGREGFAGGVIGGLATAGLVGEYSGGDTSDASGADLSAEGTFDVGTDFWPVDVSG
ncbi:type II toxin-antitoxin system prevent-host-death family antitoxin [Allosaccharopolyspora coralli]|uniref:Antitoxin n=1 Tax=Allosaccharopolyspora coralli TaxID=2665642 RepID=A0A5Q3QJH8_9PSEU|nr:type II toxin-antitoxin system prevent-host-death family antitoxin [Allosaccharopolyspora coralli]QGK70987.1 type II toxin-antitoxin system prevent-host-death family antitoxin [Allosaccharopolyspora coralli]